MRKEAYIRQDPSQQTFLIIMARGLGRAMYVIAANIFHDESEICVRLLHRDE